MSYDPGVEGVLAAFGRRPVAGVGLAVAIAWILVVVVESTTTDPWDQGGWYSVLLNIAGLAWKGVVAVGAFVWLVERAGAA
jgi:hypothetical protein